MNHLFAVYRKHTLPSRGNTTLDKKGWEEVFQTNRRWKQTGTAILDSYKIKVKPKLMSRDKESHFILFCTIHQEDITFLNTKVKCNQFHKTNITRQYATY